MNPIQGIASDDLFGKTSHFVVQDNDMIAVPSNAPADVNEEFLKERQNRRNLVRNRLRRMEMAHVEADHLLPRYRIPHVEFVGTHDVRFAPDAEQLALQGILHLLAFVFLTENIIQGFF